METVYNQYDCTVNHILFLFKHTLIISEKSVFVLIKPALNKAFRLFKYTCRKLMCLADLHAEGFSFQNVVNRGNKYLHL